MSKNIFIICAAMVFSFLGCAKQQPLTNANDAVHSEQNDESLKADSGNEASCENDSCDFEDCADTVWPPIHCYVTEELAKQIVSQNGDVNALNANEETPLMFAKDVKTAKILIDAGADLNGKANGRTRAQMMTPLIFAINLGKTDIARTLIESGADLNATDEDMQRPPLINSLENENIEIAKLLIESGADVNKPSKYGEIALIEAIRLNYAEIAQMLIKAGADVNAKDQFDRTPLALRKNMLEEAGQSADDIEKDEIIILLKSNGAYIH